MTAHAGRLEAQLTLTSVTQDFVSSAGTVTVSLNGTYYLTDLIADMTTQLGANGITIAWSSGEGTTSQATGKVTINAAGFYPWHVTWTSTLLRDILGFEADVAATSAPTTGTLHAVGGWLPSVVKFTRHGDLDAGVPVTDFRQSVSPTGAVYSMKGNSYNVIDGLTWNGVPGQRARVNLEQVAGESYEAFLRKCQFGEHSAFAVGAPVRLIWNADSSSVYGAGTFLHQGSFDPDATVAGWTGRYTIAMPRFILS